jgi:hypothetical protein
MTEKRRAWWLLIAFILTLWLCMFFMAGSIVFATQVDGELQRFPSCRFFDEPIWRYSEGTSIYNDKITDMAQTDRATHVFICIQLT